MSEHLPIEQLQLLIDDRPERELPSAPRDHLAGCPECRARLDLLRDLSAALRGESIPAVPETLRPTIRRRLPSRSPYWLRWGPVAAVLVLAALLPLVLEQRRENRQSAIEPQAAPEATANLHAKELKKRDAETNFQDKKGLVQSPPMREADADAAAAAAGSEAAPEERRNDLDELKSPGDSAPQASDRLASRIETAASVAASDQSASKQERGLSETTSNDAEKNESSVLRDVTLGSTRADAPTAPAQTPTSPPPATSPSPAAKSTVENVLGRNSPVLAAPDRTDCAAISSLVFIWPAADLEGGSRKRLDPVAEARQTLERSFPGSRLIEIPEPSGRAVAVELNSSDYDQALRKLSQLGFILPDPPPPLPPGTACVRFRFEFLPWR